MTTMNDFHLNWRKLKVDEIEKTKSLLVKIFCLFDLKIFTLFFLPDIIETVECIESLTFFVYSETYLQRTPLGPQDSVLYRDMSAT